MNPQKYPQRKSPRLKGYDYSQNGAYFVTIVTHQRCNLFGHIDRDGIMHLNDFGEIASDCWLNIPKHFPNIELDVFVIMPNHTHGIVMLSETHNPKSPKNVGERHASPLHSTPKTNDYRVKFGSIIAMVGSYKSAVTKLINRKRNKKTPPVWHRSFHDRIIRDEHELNVLREYTLYNPALWTEDRHFTE